MQRITLKHQAGAGLIQELAQRVYRSPMETFREVTSNSIDEGSKKIHIKLAAKEIIFEDFGKGIQNVKKFVVYGESIKNDNKGEIIGEKGLGKLSLLMLNEDKVQFLTNNGYEGMDITMNKIYFDIKKGKVDEFLDHQGTKIIITNPIFVPTQAELVKYLSRTFGLWIKKGIDIKINDEKVQPFKHIDIQENKIITSITGNIKEDPKGNGSLDLYIKHVYVTSILVDPNYLYSGWINCNKLTPTTSRDDVVKDEEFRKMLLRLKEFVKKFPEKQPKDFSNEEKMLAIQISKMAEMFVEANELKISGGTGRKSKKEKMIEVAVGDKESIILKQEEEEEEQNDNEDETLPLDSKTAQEETQEQKLPDKLNKPIQHINRNKHGVITIVDERGDEDPPFFFYPPNVIVINKTNSLYRFAVKPKSNFGPQYFRILLWLIRAFVDMESYIKQWYKDLSNDEIIKKRDEEVDKGMKLYLSYYNAI